MDGATFLINVQDFCIYLWSKMFCYTSVKSNSYNVDFPIIQKYDLKRRIGKGAYGIVWKAIDRKKRIPVAVKKVYDAFRNSTDAQRTYREIVYLQEFQNHPNIVKLLSVHRALNNLDIYLVFEYFETDLHKCIKRETILQDIHKRFIIYQLLKALKYIHSGNVIHRDLKPPNILINSRCHCKIADFGLARSVAPNVVEEQPVLDAILTDYIATRWYRAPEILLASKSYSKSIDMWSVGCILGEMLLGKPLFPGSSTVNQLELIINTLGSPSSHDAESVCSGYGNSLLKQSPQLAKVMSLSSLLPSASSDALDLLSRFLILNPNRRITASEALKHNYVQIFSEPLKETSLTYSIVPPVRDDTRLSIDHYRNKINDTILKSEQKQSRKTKPNSIHVSLKGNECDCLVSQIYSSHSSSHKCLKNQKPSNHHHHSLHSIENMSVKQPSTYPPYRTSNNSQVCSKDSNERQVQSILQETILKTLKKKSVILPPAKPKMPVMEHNLYEGKGLKTYFTSVQDYSSNVENSPMGLFREKIHLPKWEKNDGKSLKIARPSVFFYGHTSSIYRNDDASKKEKSELRSIRFMLDSFESSLKKNLAVPVTKKKQLPSTTYPRLEAPINFQKAGVALETVKMCSNKRS